MTPDHEAAKKWAQTYDDCEDVMPNACNLAACYLDAMARLAKATELLRTTSEWADSVNPAAQLAVDIRAFLERKTDDKQS